MSVYEEVYKQSIENPEAFWAEAAKKVHWYHEWDKVLDVVNDHYRWFVGGCMNTCYNALDLHIENGRGDQVALHYRLACNRYKKVLHLQRATQKSGKNRWNLSQ